MDSGVSTEPPSTPRTSSAFLGIGAIAGEEPCSYEEIEMMIEPSHNQVNSRDSLLLHTRSDSPFIHYRHMSITIVNNQIRDTNLG